MCPRPNASWDGTATNFCFGMATDDVVGHEWIHAYTMSTHQLIYAYQPGALNESYSDIFGELLDLLNDQGLDEPGPARTDGKCSTFGGEANNPYITIHSPASLAGTFSVGSANSINPDPPWSVPGEIELVDDGVGNTSDACDSLVGFTPGHIAFIEAGGCTDRQKFTTAADAGAAAVIRVTTSDWWAGAIGYVDPVDGPYPTAVSISKWDAETFRAALADGIEVTIEKDIPSDVSVRWLLGEDTVPKGAIRDMWNPLCFHNPNMVPSAIGFACGNSVHSSSGVPNHAFALLVDGGTFNRRTVGAIGATRAAHIYWRAMSVYQVPTTDFADHADLLELSCTDLVGAVLTNLVTGEPSPETIRPGDCEQVAEAMAAVNMRGVDEWCSHLETVLAPNAPPVWTGRVVFSESFDRDPGPSWRRSNQGVYREYDTRDWVWTDQLPEGGDGGGIFATDIPGVGDCEPGSDDQSGVMHLDSPSIDLPESIGHLVLLFDHYVAIEPVRDGGNLKISVNGGPFQEIGMGAFLFNPYNSTIDTEPGSATNTNPLTGEKAFSGLDEGKVVGSWGQTQIALDDLAQPGDTLQLRFDLGTDGCTHWDGRFADGWYVKNLKIVETVDPTRRPAGRMRP
jgi:hypothetical protein